MDPDQNGSDKISNRMARSLFGVGPDPAERGPVIRRLLASAVLCAVLVPALFFLRFGVVDGFAWGLTIFFVGYCLLAAVGLYFGPRQEFHTPVKLVGDWADRIGAFWLVACVFGPFFGWALTSILPLTLGTWRWVYGLGFFLGGLLPALTALPPLRYLRGKAVLVGLPILVIVTMLAVWSVVNVGRDLWAGPLVQQVGSGGQMRYWLQYTGRFLGGAP